MRSTTLALVSFCLLLPCGGATAQVSVPLSLDQIHCDADRLWSLLKRTEFDSAQSAKSIAVTWTLGNAEGHFSGLALSTQFPEPTRPFDFEKQLWMDLHAATSLLRD